MKALRLAAAVVAWIAFGCSGDKLPDAANETKDFLDCRGEVSHKMAVLHGAGCVFVAQAVTLTLRQYPACVRAGVPTDVEMYCDAGEGSPDVVDGGAE